MFNIVSELKKPSPFTSVKGGSVSVDFIFQIMLGSKEISHHFLSPIESTLVLTFRIISLQIYWTTLHSTHYTPFTTDSNPEWQRVPHASKLIKLSEKHIFFLKLLSLLCNVCSMPATFVINRCSPRRLEDFTQMIRLILIYLWPNHSVTAP